MESTGSYWKPIYNVLDDGKLQAILADSQQVKNLQGHRTDNPNDSNPAELRPEPGDARTAGSDAAAETVDRLCHRNMLDALAFLEHEIAQLDRAIAARVESGPLQPAVELVQTKSGTTKGNPWARRTLVECAWSATRKKDSATQARYLRLKPKIQHKRAVAVAHWMTLKVHEVLSTGQPRG